MAVNKVVLGEDTLIDLTADTVSADKLSKGVTAHNMAGEPIVGTMEATGGKEYTFTNGLTETNGTVSWDLDDRIKTPIESGIGSLGVMIGDNNYVYGKNNFIVGEYCTNNGNYSTSIGYNCYSQGGNSLAVGRSTQAMGPNSAAFGEYTTVSSQSSFICGLYTDLPYDSSSSYPQFAEGKYNIKQPAHTHYFEHQIGNGVSDENRSNASALDWQGNQYLSGDIYTNCTDYTTTSTGLNTPRCGGQKLIPIPEPPSSGTYVLKAVDGIMSWVAE